MTVDCAAVDFDLSADQQALREAAAALLEGKAGHDALRARVGTGAVVGTLPGAGEASAAAGATDAPHGYDADAWDAMSEQGWLAIELPEDEGGLGLGLVEVAVLCEELGRRLVAAPFLPSVVALAALSRSGKSARSSVCRSCQSTSVTKSTRLLVRHRDIRWRIVLAPSRRTISIEARTGPSSTTCQPVMSWTG